MWKVISIKPAVPVNIVLQDDDGQERSLLGYLDYVNKTVQVAGNSLDELDQIVFEYLDRAQPAVVLPEQVQKYAALQASMLEKKTQLIERSRNGVRRDQS